MSGMRMFAITTLCLLCLAGCERDEPAAQYDPIVVWTSYADVDYLQNLFVEFTSATGVPVIVRSDREAVLIYNLIENIGSQPADVYMTRNITNLVRAADEGALRPIQSARLAEVANELKDADRMWTAINFQQTLVFKRVGSDLALPVRVYDLADSAYRNRLCLTSSELPVNQDMVAMMIADLGEKAAERVVRGWVSNLAAAPFADESALLDAVADGECDVAIVSGWGSSRIFSNADMPFETVVPKPGYLQVEAVGVGRHARYPQSAYLFIDWLLDAAVSERHALHVLGYPAYRLAESGHTGQPASAAGWRNQDARQLIERAAYR